MKTSKTKPCIHIIQQPNPDNSWYDLYDWHSVANKKITVGNRLKKKDATVIPNK